MNPSEMCNGGSPGMSSSSSSGGEGNNSPANHHINPPMEGGSSSKTVSPEMLYKLSKKIAQLTKVIYSLNTRNDDLSSDMEAMQAAYEEKIHRLSSEVGINGGAEGIHSPDSELLSSNESLKKELGKARNSLKNMETKMAEREEENRQMIESLNIANNGDTHQHSNGLCAHSSQHPEDSPLSKKVNQLVQEKAELTKKLDRKDVLAESLKLERESLQKEIKDLSESMSSLKLELSAARVELSYRENSGGRSVEGGEDSAEFTDELIRRIEELTNDKSGMVTKLEEGHLISVQQRSQIEDQKKVIDQLQVSLQEHETHNQELNEEILRLENENNDNKGNDIDPADIVERVTKELQTQHETTLLDSKKFYEKEIKDLQESFHSSENTLQELRDSIESQSKIIRERDEEIESLRSQNAQILAESEAAAKGIKESTLEDCQRQMQEANNIAEKRMKELQSTMDQRIEELQGSLREMTSGGDDLKMRLLESESSLARKEKEFRDKIKQLEEALEQSMTEREEILLAAGDEIQNEKDIALAIEQRLMDDFEWKLREIEREHRQKLEELKSEAEGQIRAANDTYNRSKDESFTKMSIDLHRDLEDKLKAERLSLKSSYDEQSHRDKESVYARSKVEFDREKRALEKSFAEERTGLEREIRALKRRVDDFPNELSRMTASLKKETENIEREGNVRLALLQEKNHKDIEEHRQIHLTELSRAKSELQGRINDLESRLRASDGHRLDSIFKVREDVEVEFAEKMETLRDMYMGEVEKESHKVEELTSKLSVVELRSREMTQKTRSELEELNTYIALREEEHESKVNELLTRLQEQTTLAVRLQEEIDEYDWYIEDEEGNITERAPTNERPASGGHRISRPPSTRPFRGSTLSLNSQQQQQPRIESPLESEEVKRAPLDPEFVEEEYLEEEYYEEETEQPQKNETDLSTPTTTNTKLEASSPVALSKASSASSVSYSSVASDAYSREQSEIQSSSKAATSSTKKHGKRSHCAQQ